MSRALFCWLLRWFIGRGIVDCRTLQPSWLTNRLNIFVTITGMNILVMSFTRTFKRYSVERGIMMLPVVVVVVVVDGDDDDDEEEEEEDDDDDDDDFNP